VKKENVKINKMSGKKRGFFLAHFCLFGRGGGLLVKEKKKAIINKRKGRNAITWEFPGLLMAGKYVSDRSPDPAPVSSDKHGCGGTCSLCLAQV
jgi:hypothetical protein